MIVEFGVIVSQKKMITPASQIKICKDCGHPFKEGMTWCVEVKQIFQDDHCKNCSVESFLYYSVDLT